MSHVCRVLVVEDHSDTARSLTDLLELHGFEVHASRDGKSEDLASFMPDVALVDLGLPDRDGYAVGKELLDRYPHCKVVIVSAHGFPQHMEESQKNGFLHLVKPVDPHLLKRLLDDHCEEIKQGDECPN